MTQNVTIFYEKLDNELNIVKTPFAIAKTQEDAILFCKHNLLFSWSIATVQNILPYIVIDTNQTSYRIHWP